MYSTCLFCRGGLGANREIEPFPVGTRLAFDSARGRLWVVCARCGRWNLSPLEERWEAIEAAERLFERAPVHRATEQIGLARLPSGLDLVRVGRPSRPEMVAWRYAPGFRTRRARATLWTGGTVAALGAANLLSGPLAVLTAGSATVVTGAVCLAYYARFVRRPVARLDAEEGTPRIVRAAHVAGARLVPTDEAPGWRLRLPHDRGAVEVWGETADWTASRILSHLNLAGADDAEVEQAVREVERHPDADGCFRGAIDVLRARPLAPAVEGNRFLIEHLPSTIRLALEIAASEAAERRAMEGELRLLEAAWREAEEIAGIADRLALPRRIERALRRGDPAPA